MNSKRLKSRAKTEHRDKAVIAKAVKTEVVSGTNIKTWS